jgi:glycosyltransferase involved in cell wall biosynthesis
MPQYFPKVTAKAFDKWLRVIVQTDGALCISRTVADDLAKWIDDCAPQRLQPFKIGVFHIGADIENSIPTLGLNSEATQVLKTLGSRPSFLMVGTLEPRKGHAQSLDAFERLWAEGFDVNLVIVGKCGWDVDTLTKHLRNHPEFGERLFWLEGISDEYLEKVYAACSCLIAASEGEGFGLPLIEAARHKLPILARDISVFREVAGTHVFYFSGLEAVQLENAVKQWLVLFREHKHPRSDNLQWLTWKQSARQLVDSLLSL